MIDLQDLQAKSDQMNAIDFIKPMVFKISKVGYFPKQEQPILLHLEGYDGRPYKPCKSMLRGITQVWGMDETKWVGNMLELYCDPSVKWAGKEHGGIRISAVSGIKEPFEFTVQLNRSQRKIQKWNVIPDDQAITREFVVTHFEADIAEAETNDSITAILADVRKDFGEDAMNQLKDAAISARAKLNQSQENTEGN